MATNIKYLNIDSKGRICLGKLTKNIIRFKVEVDETGKIILSPEVAVPLDEVWLYENKNAFKSVKSGLKEAKDGETKDLGSFSRYCEED